MHKSRVLDLLPDDEPEPAGEGATDHRCAIAEGKFKDHVIYEKCHKKSGQMGSWCRQHSLQQ